MDAVSIGIKLADSKFFPILQEGTSGSKVLELTTVHDEQTSVQINLFRGSSESVDTAEYVGTLIIEDIMEKPSGEPTIELTVSLDEANELSAEAVDLDSGTRQALKVSLETLEADSLKMLPDFDLSTIDDTVSLGEDPQFGNLAVNDPIQGNAPEGLYEMNTEKEKKNGVFMPAWLCILILVIGVLALVLALLVSARVMILNRSLSEANTTTPVTIEAPIVPAVEPTPAETTQPEPDVTTPPPVETPEEKSEPVVTNEPIVPVQPEPVPEAKPIHYKIKWGDTLWDIADAYYRNPWLYKKIANYNKIRNPNLIIAGTWLDIPAR